MISYKGNKIAAQELYFTLPRNVNGELNAQECSMRFVSNRYLGTDGVLSLGNSYLSFTEVPQELLGQLDLALTAIYECEAHTLKLKAKAELQDGDLVVNGDIVIEQEV